MLSRFLHIFFWKKTSACISAPKGIEWLKFIFYLDSKFACFPMGQLFFSLEFVWHYTVWYLTSFILLLNSIIDDETLLKILRLPILVILDEAYVEFSGMESKMKWVKKHENLIVLRTFSKRAGRFIHFYLTYMKTSVCVLGKPVCLPLFLFCWYTAKFYQLWLIHSLPHSILSYYQNCSSDETCFGFLLTKLVFTIGIVNWF